MPIESLCFDLKSKRPVRSRDDLRSSQAPWEFASGDLRSFGVTFVTRQSLSKATIEPATFAVVVSLADVAAPTVALCEATAGAAVNNEYPFLLNLADPLLVAYMSTKTVKTAVVAQFAITGPDGGLNRYQFTINVTPKISTAVAVVPPGETALTVNGAAGLFVARKGTAGALQVMVSPSGKKFAFYVGDDGLPHFDPIP